MAESQLELNPEDYKNILIACYAHVLGNTNVNKGFTILHAIVKRVNDARQKHQLFAEGKYQALGVIESEAKEFAHAIEKESEDRQINEALDVIATCIRFLNGEYKTEK